MCLSQVEQARVKGFVLNKFRGEQTLFADANQWVLQQTGIPIVAVLPWTAHQLSEEDNFFHRNQWQLGTTNIALMVYPFASNLDEFDRLIYQAGVNLVPLRDAQDSSYYDAIILSGSKNVSASRMHLAQSGLDQAIIHAAKQGVRVTGICGGLQILGEQTLDPLGLEGQGFEGLVLLPIITEYADAKVTTQRDVEWQEQHLACYEIHHAASPCVEALKPFVEQVTGWQLGVVQGSYLHDLFINRSFRQHWLESLAWQGKCEDWQQVIGRELDPLCEHLDLPLSQISQHAGLS